MARSSVTILIGRLLMALAAFTTLIRPAGDLAGKVVQKPIAPYAPIGEGT